MKQNTKKLILAAVKCIAFLVLFLIIFNYTSEVLRNKSESEALGVITKKPDNSYDVILAGSSHMQFTLQPAQLFGEHGITSCNVSTAAQSVPTTYYLVKEMIERHNPKLVIVDLFCLFYPENYFTPTRFHQAVDNLTLSATKIEAINDLVDVNESEFFINYLLYHSRWKELQRYDYKIHSEVNETYQLLELSYPFPEPFVPLPESDTADIPDIPLKYLEKIATLCKEKNVELLLTVVPYRADIDNNSVTGVYQQQLYNKTAELAKEWGIDYFNALHHLDEIDFDFMTDMCEYSHMNAPASKKVTEFYGKLLKENYDLPDHRDTKYADEWQKDYTEYLAKVEEISQKLQSQKLQSEN